MAQRGPARTFTEEQLDRLLRDVTDEQDNKRSGAQASEVIRVAFMLSFYAGLRVQEIAGLQWALNIFQGDGEFRTAPTVVYDMHGKPVRDKHGDEVMQDMEVLFINDDIGKYGKSRNIPLHPRLRTGLLELCKLQLEGPWVIPAGKQGAGQGLRHRAHALKMRMNRLYKVLGIDRATSHSGRRSFITRAARRANAYDASLVDVRDLAGHASINTTQFYVDPSPQQGALVKGVWK